MAAVLLSSAVAEPAGSKEYSEKSVKILMKYAWQLVPTKFTRSDGSVMKIDKSKKAAHMIPLANAREIVKVGRLSGHAQICGLIREETANHLTLMRMEDAKKKWTKEQIVFINQLHLVTVYRVAGYLKLQYKDGKQEVILDENTDSKRKPTCNDDQRKNVRQQINAYVCKHKTISVEGCKE